MAHLYHDEGPAGCERKVLLATPAYDNPDASYTFAISRSRAALTEAGIPSAYLLLSGHCHVDDSRNQIVRHFLESDCTELLFLDADVTWEPKDIVQLCSHDLDIVGGVYPYRREGGEQMPVRMMDGRLPENGLLEVEGLPTGFMKIKRSVLEKMAKERPTYFDKIFETVLMFDRPMPGEDKTRWGGDIDFCNRWRAMGGKLFADVELRLGHAAKIIVRDSLGAHLRRVFGTTLTDLAPRFRDGVEKDTDYNEVFRYGGNNYAADSEILAVCVAIARKCRGPIIETGSGLSSVLMAAAAPDVKIYSLEHLEAYAAQTIAWAEEAGVKNVGVHFAPLKDFWYDLDKFDLPNKFAFGFCDGPPRKFGSRMQFFEKLAPRCTVILVDDVKDDHKFSIKVREWCSKNGRSFELLGRAALLKKEA